MICSNIEPDDPAAEDNAVPDSPGIRPARPDEVAEMSRLALRSKAHWGYSKEFLVACKAELTVEPARLGTGEHEHFVCCNSKSILGFYALERHSRSTSTEVRRPAP